MPEKPNKLRPKVDIFIDLPREKFKVGSLSVDEVKVVITPRPLKEEGNLERNPPSLPRGGDAKSDS